MNFEAGRSTPGAASGENPPGSGAAGGQAARLSEAEFARLLARARPALFVVASAVLGDRSEADDVVQEASVIGLATLGRFAPGTSFEGWMAQIVRNVARNALRKRSRNPARGVGGEGFLDRGVPADSSNHIGRGAEAAVLGDGSSANPAHFEDRVRRALDSLDEVSRICLLLRTVGDMSYAQIAAITDLNENTAMSHVFRSRRAMREILEAPSGRQREGGER